MNAVFATDYVVDQVSVIGTGEVYACVVSSNVGLYDSDMIG